MSEQEPRPYCIPSLDDLVSAVSITSGKRFVGLFDVIFSASIGDRNCPIARIHTTNDKTAHILASLYAVRRPTADEEAAWRLSAEPSKAPA